MTRVAEAAAPASSAAPTPSRRSSFLTQIQALRAVAVLLVVLYHLWPTKLTGGYIGVDVFFVISGFLMTRHLVGRSEQGMGLGAALNEFYIRRIRRIAPASLVMLAGTTFVVIFFVSRVKWDRFLHEIFASTLYFENWALAASSTDYLAADTGASPVQHFWSLAVEEQFYLVWPLLILIVGVLAARRRRVHAVVIAAVAAASFGYGQYALAHNPSAAYFDTFARLWEFAVGALVALAFGRYRLPRAIAAALAWIGLALIGYTAYHYTGSTAFPGVAAVAPALGAAAVIGSGDSSVWWGPHRLLALRPVQFTGDISYSVYLWHWPIIALWYPVLDEKLTTKTKLLVFVVALVLGYLSKVLVEDRFRAPRRGGHARRSRLRTAVPRLEYAWLVLAVVPLLAVVLAAQSSIGGQERSARASLAALEQRPPTCYGGEVLDNVKPGCSPQTVTLHHLVPSPLIASSGFEASACQQRATRSAVETCSFGSTASGATSVALVGDSHATQWLPALSQLASANGWRLTTYLMSGCPLSTHGSSGQCAEWNRRVLTRLRSARYQFVLVAARSLTNATSTSAIRSPAAALAAAWSQVQRDGSKVIALADVPQPADAGVGDIPSCVYDHSSASACEIPRGAGTRFDIVRAAAQTQPGVRLVDLTDSFCVGATCYAVIGNVLVYLDDNHMTPTFARSLETALQLALRSVGLPVR